MALFVWSENFSVNVKSFNNQHKRLVDIINEFHDAMMTGKGKEILEKTLNELVDYTKRHFSEEELTMKVHKYPEFIFHKTEHDNLVKKVTESYNKFMKGENVYPMDMLKFLTEWLQKHILNTDKKYTPYLNSKGVV